LEPKNGEVLRKKLKKYRDETQTRSKKGGGRAWARKNREPNSSSRGRKVVGRVWKSAGIMGTRDRAYR